MAHTASPGGMIPEQVWDDRPVPQRRLRRGRPTGSAMPLAWAHAEFIKLAVSRGLGRPFDRPQAVWDRYNGAVPTATTAFWWPHAGIRQFPAGVTLVIALPDAGVVYWGTNGWSNITKTEARDTGVGFFAATLNTSTLRKGERVNFTIRWQNGDWIGADYDPTVE